MYKGKSLENIRFEIANIFVYKSLGWNRLIWSLKTLFSCKMPIINNITSQHHNR